MQTAADGSSIARLRGETTAQLTTFNNALKTKTIPVQRGKTITIGEVRGQGYIANLWITFPGWFWRHWERSAPVSQAILKTLILRIYWDGEPIPAIQAPVGDFFGNGLCEVTSFTSRYFGMSSGGFYCKFPMPYRKGFRIDLENRDAQIDTEVFANVLYQITDAPPAEIAYLHAQFHTARNPGPEPVTILEAEGRGHYVGCTLAAQGEEKNYFSFLEAPENVFIDDDWQTARIVGTGLEDYFLGGWYFREGAFAGDLHGVPSKDPLRSSITMYRVHDLDAISFQRRIRFEFRNPWEPGRLRPFAYSSVAFAYLDTPGGCNQTIPSAHDLLCWHDVRNTDHVSIP